MTPSEVCAMFTNFSSGSCLINIMQGQFYAATNPQGSLRIYDPPGQPTISNTFFASERYAAVGGAPPKSKPYVRQESIIDKLGNREETSQEGSGGEKGTSSHVSPKPTSIEFLVDIAEQRQPLLKLQPLRIEDIFANRPPLYSQEIKSGMLEERSRNSTSQIVLPTFPSRQYMSDSPERPNLNRPFLRKKTSSIRQSEIANPTLPPKNDQSFEAFKLETAIRHLKQYNSDLMSVLRNLQALQEDEGNSEWRGMGPKELQLLKLMVEKAIISKEDH